MNDALCSILCDQQDGWIADPYYQDKLKFNPDGTGEVWFLEDHTYLFAVNFQWKRAVPFYARDDTALATATQSRNARSTWSMLMGTKQQSQTLGILRLEITLTKSLANGLEGRQNADAFAAMNDDRLSDAACRPKPFIVTIEKGNFPAGSLGRYELRVSFDTTLVPPQAEFVKPNEGILDGAGWWKIKTYVARELPE